MADRQKAKGESTVLRYFYLLTSIKQPKGRSGSVAVMHNVPDQPLGHLAMSHARHAQDIRTTMFMTLPSISTWAVSAPSVCSTCTVTTDTEAQGSQKTKLRAHTAHRQTDKR